ncbi:hypothetical protein PXK56_18140 [Phaeobacter gallaeciensis]|nr:hypothetical protein [Phaeobacter gallaeciensis]MDE4297111.1 hypothetical protein [Phaeobacter gallaeciensis]
MFEKFEANFSIVVSTIVLAALAAVLVARAANSEPMPAQQVVAVECAE